MCNRLALAALLIVGCASSTGVQPLGRGVHRVETGSEFGLAQAQQKALQEARQYCQTFGGTPQEISSQSGSRRDAVGDRIDTYEIVFRCSGAGEPTHVASPVYPTVSRAGGHIQLENRTGQPLRIECGHHGDHGSSHNVSPGHSGGLSVNHIGEVDCRAVDHHGTVVASRRFNFHHGDESFYWQVHDHHN